MSFKNNEKSNYNLDYEFLTILYLSRVLCSMDEWASKNMTIYLILIYITSNTNIWVLGKPIKMMQVTKLSSFWNIEYDHAHASYTLTYTILGICIVVCNLVLRYPGNEISFALYIYYDQTYITHMISYAKL